MAYEARTGYDVVVVGGGTAGTVAAVAAARNGARTLLCERHAYVGGMAGTGMFMFGVDDGSGEPAVRGVLQEMFDRLIANGWAYPHQPNPMFGSITPVDGEMARCVLLDMLLEAGADLSLHTQGVAALVEDGAVRGVVAQTKSGRLVITTSVVVDATGDADVAYDAGAELDFGRPGDARTQPASLIFRVGNVDTEQAVEYLRQHPDEIRAPRGFTGDDYTREFLDEYPAILLPSFAGLVARARESGDWDLLGDRVSLYLLKGRSEVVVNSTRLAGVDGTSSGDLTYAEVELLRQARVTVTFLRNYVPGFAEAYLSGVPHQAGVRETRRIRGLYQLTEQDVLSAANFTDGVARGAYPLDIHAPAADAEVLGVTVDSGHTTLVRIDRSFGVAFRCLVPVSIDGLLVAGRCISATHEAAGAIRGMSVCMATGEAAGTAAALAVGAGVSPRDVDTADLRKVLAAAGVVLGPEA